MNYEAYEDLYLQYLWIPRTWRGSTTKLNEPSTWEKKLSIYKAAIEEFKFLNSL